MSIIFDLSDSYGYFLVIQPDVGLVEAAALLGLQVGPLRDDDDDGDAPHPPLTQSCRRPHAVCLPRTRRPNIWGRVLPTLLSDGHPESIYLLLIIRQITRWIKTRVIFRGDAAGFGFSSFQGHWNQIHVAGSALRSPEPSPSLDARRPPGKAETGDADHRASRRWVSPRWIFKGTHLAGALMKTGAGQRGGGSGGRGAFVPWRDPGHTIGPAGWNNNVAGVGLMLQKKKKKKYMATMEISLHRIATQWKEKWRGRDHVSLILTLKIV